MSLLFLRWYFILYTMYGHKSGLFAKSRPIQEEVSAKLEQKINFHNLQVIFANLLKS